MTALPSIRQRLSRAALAWSLLWSAAVSVAVGLAVQHELKEQLDDRLQATAQVLTVLLDQTRFEPKATAVAGAEPRTPHHPGAVEVRLAWQVVDGERVVLRSAEAPAEALLQGRRSGFGDTDDWRVFGTALGDSGQVLYVGQTWAARMEDQFEIVLSTTLAGLAIVLVAHVWMAARLRQELQPLQSLSDELATHDPLEESARLRAPERQELAPMHAAIEALGRRLNDRLRREQAFTAHAAHRRSAQRRAARGTGRIAAAPATRARCCRPPAAGGGSAAGAVPHRCSSADSDSGLG
jgi:hypothetical protein